MINQVTALILETQAIMLTIKSQSSSYDHAASNLSSAVWNLEKGNIEAALDYGMEAKRQAQNAKMLDAWM